MRKSEIQFKKVGSIYTLPACSLPSSQSTNAATFIAIDSGKTKTRGKNCKKRDRNVKKKEKGGGQIEGRSHV